MSRPEFTPGNGGGKPAQTQRESTSTHSPHHDFGNPPPPQTEAPKPNPVTSPPPFDSGPSPYLTQEATSSAQPASSDEEADRRKQRIAEAWQRFEAAKQSASNAQLPADLAQTETLPDINELRSRYVAGVGETTLHPVDMDYRIAAQYNPVLREARIMVLQEGVPSALQSNPDLLLSLCGEFGMDEENDAEARDYLAHCMNGGSSSQNADDPLNATWLETLTAYEMFMADMRNEDARAAYESGLEAYKAQVENSFGVEFTHVEGRTVWDLLGIRMAQVAFEDMAKALGIAVREYFGLNWDDATAFRRIIGKITLHNSTELPTMATNEQGEETGIPLGIAQVRGREIVVYWNEDYHRNFYLIPHAVLHELGHILNANGAFGADQFDAWFNLLGDHPGSREGMGEPDPDVLTGKKVIYSYQSEIILPTLDQDIGIWDPDHVIYDQLREDFPTQIQSLQQSTEETPNEITADAIVNWVKHLITGGRFGFTSDEKGLVWQRIMGSHMDEQIRNAIAFNASKDERNLTVIIEQGMLPEIKGRGRIVAGTNVRSGPSRNKAVVDSTTVDREVHIFGYKDVQESPFPWIAVWYEGSIRWVYGGQIYTEWDDRRPISEKDASYRLLEQSASMEDALWIRQLSWS